MEFRFKMIDVVVKMMKLTVVRTHAGYIGSEIGARFMLFYTVLYCFYTVLYCFYTVFLLFLC